MSQDSQIMKLLDRHLDSEHLTWEDYDKLLKLIMADAHRCEDELRLRIGKLETRINNLRSELNAH